jgi:hypothetical protein
MKKDNQLKPDFDNMMKSIRNIDGKVVNEPAEFVESKIAKDDRGAWVNHMTEQYLKKEELDTPPVELNIDIDDIMTEISKREINKVFRALKWR